ncbi:MAG: 4Fe-4S dicluster domain-containing protein [Deltaproteobacteria bacterium]|nr:4Fe-4S dicluster domain-containing protein [Deltaproteobacteria bacterium]
MLEATLNFKLLEMCSRCGACYSICPSCMHIPGYDPRAVVRDILDGDYEKWLSSKHIWQCLECHFCLEMCYQHYGFENAMTALRTVAARKGMHPPQVKRGWDMFAKTSRLGEPALPARKKLNLPEPKASGADEFRKLMELLKESRHKGGKPSAKED